MGLVKTRRLAAMRKQQRAPSAYAKATADRRLRRIKGGDEAVEDFRSQIGTRH